MVIAFTAAGNAASLAFLRRFSIVAFVALISQSLAVPVWAQPLSAAHLQKESAALPGKLQVQPSSRLCAVAEQTRSYMTQGEDPLGQEVGALFNGVVTAAQVTETLRFICQIYKEDVVAKRHSRLQDLRFIQQHFDLYRWYPDLEKAKAHMALSDNKGQRHMLANIAKDKILLTKYYTKLIKGSLQEQPVFRQALYALPFDEQGLSLQQAEQKRDGLTRFRYNRQQAMTGILHQQKLAQPLVWMDSASLHDVLLQGTAILEIADQTYYFNVHRNNGIAYDYTKGKTQQSRYWYFKKVQGILGYGQDAERKIVVQPHVTFAGDLQQLGLGKLIMLSYPTAKGPSHRLGVLADTGGAFEDNLFQLDMLVGSYYGWSDYHQANKHLPDYAEARILIKRDRQARRQNEAP